MGASQSIPPHAAGEAGLPWIDGCMCMCSDARDFEAASRGQHDGAHGPRRAFEADSGRGRQPAPWYLPPDACVQAPVPAHTCAAPAGRSRFLDACSKQAPFVCGDHRRGCFGVASLISCRVSCAAGHPSHVISQAAGCRGDLQRGVHAVRS